MDTLATQNFWADDQEETLDVLCERAALAGLTLQRHSPYHISLQDGPTGWRVNLHPTTRRFYIDPRRPSPPVLDLTSGWTLARVVDAAIAATLRVEESPTLNCDSVNHAPMECPNVAIIVETKSTKSFELAPAGNHRAICYAIYDLGTQAGYEGKKQRKVRFFWELSDELMSDGRPFSVSRTYTMSLHEKATLRGMLNGWRGKPFTEEEIKRFDLSSVLGKGCMITVIHEPSKTDKTKIYANIATVGPMPKGMSPAEPINSLRQYSITDDEMPPETPEWLAELIAGSDEHQDAKHHAPADGAPAYVPAAVDDSDAPPF